MSYTYTTMAMEQSDKNKNLTNDQYINMLMSFCEYDEDMNGGNGDEYLWDETIADGFNTNSEYLANLSVNKFKNEEASPIEKLEHMAKFFLDEWLKRDHNYYSDMTFKLMCTNNVYALVGTITS